MALVAPLQGHFDGGEISPLLYGRVDADRYKASLALCKNWIPTLQGGLPRRPGNAYVGGIKNNANKSRLVPFIFSTTQAYMLEFGVNYIRFWANYGQVALSGTPYEISTPYGQSELFNLRFTQNADVIYIVHPSHPQMKLLRYGATNWQLAKIGFQDGPYLPIVDVISPYFEGQTTGTTGNVGFSVGGLIDVTGAANNGSGAIRLTLSSQYAFRTGDQIYVTSVGGTTEADGVWTVTVVNATHVDLNGSTFVHSYTSGGAVNPAPFASTDVGRLIRLEATTGGKWVWAVITAFNFPNNVSVDLQGTLGSTGISSYALGVWSDTTGYPSTACFHQDRLCFAGNTSFPQRIDASNSSDYENFSPSEPDGTVQDNNALDFSLNANDVNLIAWLDSDEKGLLTGSVSSEWVLRPSVQAGALTPTNVDAGRSTKWGSSFIQSVKVGKATMFVQRGGRKLREMLYYFDIDGFRSVDLTELAEHITGTGVIDLAYQSIPISVAWMVRNDGALIGMTYDRDISQLRTGWHQHILGGQSDANGTPPIIESIAVIPSPDGTRDDLWMIVQRYVNGAVVRYVEYMTKIFEDIDAQNKAFFVDCGATYDNPLTPETIGIGILGNPPNVKITAHGFTTGDTVRFDNVTGVYPLIGNPKVSLLNGKLTTITVVDADNFTLDSINLSGASAYLGTGQCRKYVTTISGLTYLENETVSIYADGCVQPPQPVSNSGTITLTKSAVTVTVGYPYNSDGQQLRLEAGSRNGTSLGKTRRTHRIGIMLHRSQAFMIGADFSKLDRVQFRNQGVDVNGLSLTLFSGILSETLESDYDFDNQTCFRVSDPVPCTLLALMPMLETQDRA